MSTRHWLAVAAGIGLAAGCADRDTPQDDLAVRLDSAMTRAVRARAIPGGALVAVKSGRVLLSKGYGQADLAAGRPATDSTPFVIGSTSKPLTAIAVLRLVARGAVALDTPIVRYVPELKFTDPRGQRITLRHLLTNRSGMPVGFSGPAYERPAVQESGAVERLMHESAKLPLLFEPGAGYAYSNRGWTLAGYVVQRVSGMSIERFMDEEVFEPAGMTGTTLAFWTVPDLAQGYVLGRETTNLPRPASLTRAYGPSGMVVSTARDVGALLLTLLAGGRTPDGRELLPADLVAEMFRAQADAEGELGGPTRYGLGWEVDSALGALTVKKAGSVHTMVSLWVLLPEHDAAFGLLANREDYGILPLVAELAALLAGNGEAASPQPVQPLEVAPFTAPRAVPVSRSIRSDWVGAYDTRFGDVSIYERNDSLFTRFEGGDDVLVPASDTTAVLVSDVVSHAGRTFRWGRAAGGTTLWLDGDSLGVKTRRD